MKKAKKIIALLLALTMMLAMTSCAQKTEEQEHIHKIGVIVYDLKDEQVQAFREYMEMAIWGRIFLMWISCIPQG